MKTIAENLQTIKDSTDAIKLAIIDKGGTIEGDISTWADAINGIESGGTNTDEELLFNATSWDEQTLVGSLNTLPFSPTYINLIYKDNSMNSSRLLTLNLIIYNTDSVSFTLGTPGPEGFCLFGILCTFSTDQGQSSINTDTKIAKIII